MNPEADGKQKTEKLGPSRSGVQKDTTPFTPSEAIPRTVYVEGRDVIEKELFYERDHLLQDELEYPRTGKEPGLVIIFNHDEYEAIYAPRPGSKKDVNEITLCLGRHGYNIKKEYIFQNLKRKDILEIIDKIVQKDLSEYNALLVFFLSHGDDFNELRTYDYGITAHELWQKFAECEHLKSKPKLFFIQACKGEERSQVAGKEHKEVKLMPENSFQKEFLYPDMLVFYATAEGDVSFRHPLHGSWFIQELCKNFYTYGRRDDIISLLVRVTKCVTRNYYHEENYGTIVKQTPVFVSTLSKKFYLNKNRDRNYIIETHQNYKNLEKIVMDLAQKVNDMYEHYEGKEKGKGKKKTFF